MCRSDLTGRLMRRRDFVALAGAAAAFPRLALAQQAAKVPRIAILSTPLPPLAYDFIAQGLAQHGYADGSNVIVERFIAATTDELSSFAAMAVAGRPDVILCATAPGTQAAMNATTTIPIVMLAVNDPYATRPLNRREGPQSGRWWDAERMGTTVKRRQQLCLDRMAGKSSRGDASAASASPRVSARTATSRSSTCA